MTHKALGAKPFVFPIIPVIQQLNRILEKNPYNIFKIKVYQIDESINTTATL